MTDGPSSTPALSQDPRPRRNPRRDLVPGFEITGDLGHGRGATVYRARDLANDEIVALKVYRRRMNWTPEQVDEHRQLVMNLSGLADARIQTARGIERNEERTWLVLPLVEGKTLAERISWARGRAAGGRACHNLDLARRRESRRKKPTIGVDPRQRAVSLVKLLEIFEEIARALELGHRAGLVHGDLRPKNVMIRRDERPVLLDWGVATSRRRTGFRRERETLTDSRYFDPECLKDENRPADIHADLWALGVMLFEALTLELPHQAATRSSLHTRIKTTSAPSLRRHARPQPRILARFVARALALDVAQRPASAEAFADALARLRKKLQHRIDRPSLLDRLRQRYLRCLAQLSS